MLTPQKSHPAVCPTSQLGFPELVASWIGTREQCTRNRLSGHGCWWGEGVAEGACEDFLQLSGVSGGCSEGGVGAAGSLEERQKDHLSAIGTWGARGARWGSPVPLS